MELGGMEDPFCAFELGGPYDPVCVHPAGAIPEKIRPIAPAISFSRNCGLVTTMVLRGERCTSL
jgi:hypothetical protein